MQTIRRTHDRPVTLLLRAEHENAGPYYLVDRAGYGVQWRVPARETRPTGERSTSPYQGSPYHVRTTWVPIFERARLAFDLVDIFPDMSPKDAKRAADQAAKFVGFRGDLRGLSALFYARDLHEKAQARRASVATSEAASGLEAGSSSAGGVGA